MKDLTPEWTARNAGERKVLIAGEEFTYRTGATPEELLAIGDPDENTPREEMYRYLDELILLMLVPDDHERWRSFRERKDQPLTGIDIRSVYDGLLELAIGRNPTKESSSSELHEEPGTNSTGDSSPELVAASKN